MSRDELVRLAAEAVAKAEYPGANYLPGSKDRRVAAAVVAAIEPVIRADESAYHRGHGDCYFDLYEAEKASRADLERNRDIWKNETVRLVDQIMGLRGELEASNRAERAQYERGRADEQRRILDVLDDAITSRRSHQNAAYVDGIRLAWSLVRGEDQ